MGSERGEVEEGWRLKVDHNLNGRDMCAQKLPDHDAIVMIFPSTSFGVKRIVFGIIYKVCSLRFRGERERDRRKVFISTVKKKCA